MTPPASAAPPLPVPGRLNVVLAFASGAAALTLLRLASHAASTWQALLCAAAFSYVNNTLFSLLHEAVHGVFHPRARVNDAFGRALAVFFPTSFTLQRFFHLGHHRRNRSPAERFDYIEPGQNALLKRVQWYGILTGVYWLLPPLSSLLYLVSPGLFSAFRSDEDGALWCRQTGAEAMAVGVESLPRAATRGEVLLGIAGQAAAFALLGLTFKGWALCYAAFAVNWSSLQYADHAWSPLDTTRGAWNLRVNPVVRGLFLNYHHHRAHHENPGVPWIHLPRFVDPALPSPSFVRVYLSMWAGPRPLPE
ncbi:MAG TPA: fatty acid desaturase [Elusimicrobiota bacterium]|jgi:fatty acid desaturase|nr:fatty acid desaturase [Elusimicrobiota bacterium]